MCLDNRRSNSIHSAADRNRMSASRLLVAVALCSACVLSGCGGGSTGGSSATGGLGLRAHWQQAPVNAPNALIRPGRPSAVPGAVAAGGRSGAHRLRVGGAALLHRHRSRRRGVDADREPRLAGTAGRAGPSGERPGHRHDRRIPERAGARTGRLRPLSDPAQRRAALRPGLRHAELSERPGERRDPRRLADRSCATSRSPPYPSSSPAASIRLRTARGRIRWPCRSRWPTR